MNSTSHKIEIKTVTENCDTYHNDVVQIYRETYSLPPYSETEDKIQEFSQGWAERVRNEGFLLIIAYDCAKPVGMAYGWSSKDGSYWTTKLKNELGDDAAKWTADNFEFVDFAVSPKYQGHGISSRLYNSLFARVPHKTAILYTHQSETAAYSIYLKKGWSVLRSDLVFKSGKKFVLMGRVLDKT